MPQRAAGLYLQRAPIEDVLTASMAMPDWTSLESQGDLLRFGFATPAVGARYRRRVLKALMRELGARAEVHEDLLAAYLESLAEDEAGEASVADLSFTLPGLEEPLVVSVTDHIGGGSETGGMVWPASLLLAAWLLSPARAVELDGANVLELGSGVGMLGLALAGGTAIAGITMTDFMVETLDNLQRNACRLRGSAARRVSVRQLDWHESESLRGVACSGSARDATAAVVESAGGGVKGDGVKTDSGVTSAAAGQDSSADDGRHTSSFTGASSADRTPAASSGGALNGSNDVKGDGVEGDGVKGDGVQTDSALDESGTRSDWRAAASPSVLGFDLVLAADVVYDPSALPALVATLAAALAEGCGGGSAAPRCRALVASERRSEATWATFVALLDAHRLQVKDLSAEARAASAAQTTFFCPSSTLARMVLVELTARPDA